MGIWVCCFSHLPSDVTVQLLRVQHDTWVLDDYDWQALQLHLAQIFQPQPCYICSPAALLTTSAVKSGIDRNGECDAGHLSTLNCAPGCEISAS